MKPFLFPVCWRNGQIFGEMCISETGNVSGFPGLGNEREKKIVFSKRITLVVSLRLHICLTTCENLGLGNQYLRELGLRKLKNVLCKARLCTVQVCMYVNHKNIPKLFSCPFNLPAEHILAHKCNEFGIVLCLSVAGLYILSCA